MKTLSKIGLRIRYLPSMIWHISHIFIRHKLSSRNCKMCFRLNVYKVYNLFNPENDAINEYIEWENKFLKWKNDVSNK